MTSCPNCGTTVQADATFCGQCGFNLHPTTATATEPTVVTEVPLGYLTPHPYHQRLYQFPRTGNFQGSQFYTTSTIAKPDAASSKTQLQQHGTAFARSNKHTYGVAAKFI
jgi:hypothetical protein